MDQAEPSGLAVEGADAGEPPVDVELHVRESLSGSPSQLTILTTSQGERVRARITVLAVAGGEAPCLDVSPRSPRAPARGGEVGAGITQHESEGELQLSFERPHGVCAVVRGCGPKGGVVVVRVPPFLGSRIETVDLGGAACCLHVHVVGEHLGGPAADIGVSCFDEGGRRVWQGRTDAAGDVIADLSVGGFRVAVDGSTEVDRDAASVVRFLNTEVPQAEVVVLAAPEETHEVEIVALVEPGEVPSPTLLLQRIDGVRECLRCPLPQLAPGENRVTVRLPAGTYRALVLPQGCLRTDDVVVVPASTPCRISLAAEALATLDLRGLPADVREFRVRFVQREQLEETLASQSFAGPLTWRSRQGHVGRWDEGACLLVHRKNRCWMAELPAFEQGATVSVEVQPAGVLEVSMPCDGTSSPAAPALVIKGKGREVTRVLRRKLLETAVYKRAAWVTAEPLPVGEWSVQLLDGAGVSLGEKRVALAGGRLEVRFERGNSAAVNAAGR